MQQPDVLTRDQRIANWFHDHRLATILIIRVPTLVLAFVVGTIEVYSRCADPLLDKHEYIQNDNGIESYG